MVLDRQPSSRPESSSWGVHIALDLERISSSVFTVLWRQLVSSLAFSPGLLAWSISHGGGISGSVRLFYSPCYPWHFWLLHRIRYGSRASKWTGGGCSPSFRACCWSSLQSLTVPILNNAPRWEWMSLMA